MNPLDQGLEIALRGAGFQPRNQAAYAGSGLLQRFGQGAEFVLGDLRSRIGGRIVYGIKPLHPLGKFRRPDT